MTFRLFFVSCLMVFCFFSYASSNFPWEAPLHKKKIKTHQLAIHSTVMRFFDEDHDRYFAGLQIKTNPDILHINADYTYSFYEKLSYFQPYEIAVKLKTPKGKWVIGRLLFEWSWDDSFWNKNLWEPVYIEDSLRPKKAGLTGIFREFHHDKGSFLLFGSFLYLPDSTPSLQVTNGKIFSLNHWFVSPTYEKIYSMSIVPAYYPADPLIPAKSFFQFSIAGRVSYKNFYFAYAYKPMNRVRLKSPFELKLSDHLLSDGKKDFSVDIPVQSLILHHHLVSTGWILESINQPSHLSQNVLYRLKLALTYNAPEEYAHVAKENRELFIQPRSEWIVSAKGEMDIGNTIEKTKIHIAYTHQFQEGEEDKEQLVFKLFPIVKQQQFFRDDLFRFPQAISFGMKHHIQFTSADSTDMNARLIYDLFNKYFLFSFHTSITFESSVSLFVSGDLLFEKFPFSMKDIEKSENMHVHNARIYGGLQYVF